MSTPTLVAVNPDLLDTMDYTWVGSDVPAGRVPNPNKRHSRVGYPLAQGEHEPYGYTKYGTWRNRDSKKTISGKLRDRKAFAGHSMWSEWNLSSSGYEVYRVYSYNLCVAEYWEDLGELVVASRETLKDEGGGNTTQRHMSAIRMAFRDVQKVTVA